MSPAKVQYDEPEYTEEKQNRGMKDGEGAGDLSPELASISLSLLAVHFVLLFSVSSVVQ